MSKVSEVLDKVIYWNCSKCKENDKCKEFSPETCILLKKINGELKELLIKEIDCLPLSLIETSFDGVEQRYERALLLEEVKQAIENLFNKESK